MKIFLDSADPDEVARAAAWGLVDGVTTNPSLVAQAGGDVAAVVARIAEHTSGPISAECNELSMPAMLTEARQLAALHPQVVVKLPLTQAGLTCVRELAEAEVKTNVTLCFSLAQGLLAARAGATYVSPFVGRLDDAGGDGIELVERLVAAFAHYRLPTQVLAASLRHVHHVTRAIEVGADAATMPLKVIAALLRHPLTDAGLAQFTADWRRGQAARAPAAGG